MIARCGYLLSLHRLALRESESSYRRALRDEKRCYSIAEAGEVSGQEDKDYLVRQHGIEDAGKIHVVPNCLNTELFSPDGSVRKVAGRIAFVGRLVPQKNLFSLIRALEGIDGVELILIGDGREKSGLEQEAARCRVNARFLGVMPNEQMPAILNAAEIYAQVSLSEGCSPKTVLEAMSCGLPVVAGDTPGSRDAIKHGETGLLCGTAPEEIRQAVLMLLKDAAMRKRLGARARECVVNNFSVDKVLEKEIAVIRSLMSPAQM
jgi:glycosyltransferase involved in cell wall biosynthesis